jgi:hypothetical protein
VPGIPLRAHRFDPDDTDGALTDLDEGTHVVVTDLQGRYRFTDLEKGQYVITTDPNDEFSPLRRVFEAGVSDADFIIEGVRTIRVEGKVTSRAGDPLESVVILARGGATQTDGAGRYAVELKLHPESPAIAVSPRHPGYRGDQVLLHLEDAAQEGAIALDFVLDPVAKPAQPRILVRERGEGRRDRSYAPLLGSARHTVGMLPANTMTPSVMRPKP